MSKRKYTWLKDYTPALYRQKSVSLEFFLDPTKTILKSKIVFVPSCDKPSDLVLQGENIQLNWMKIDDRKIELECLTFGINELIIPKKFLGSGEFQLETENVLSPITNKSLEGLYMSEGIFVTQCEPEGFRKICYSLDRPDVLSTYTTRIHGSYAHLLSNGNPVTISKNYTKWHDPFPKPSYLFALVAGNLIFDEGVFTTSSGKVVTIKIFHKKEHIGKTKHALNCIKKAMAWDEITYGREYDLDVFNIVAVDDFNAGAMENKGLNIFNSKYILYDENFSTDSDYALIEAIIAHEYFHNWTGNRVTCRDWFQLCVKEGLTVLREQEYVEDQLEKEVSRINQTDFLIKQQFKEDAGSLSHSVRPTKYVEINNFYTATVYEKSAEIIRMLKTIIGREKFLEGMDQFFKNQDGCACTLEDFQEAFEHVLDKNLDKFFKWFHEPGTPRLIVSEKYVGKNYKVTFRQEKPMKSGKYSNKVMPITYKILSSKGHFLQQKKTLVLDKKTSSIELKNQNEKPAISVLNSFSAPVLVEFKQPIDDLFSILEFETDFTSIWMAKKKLDYVALEKIACSQTDVEDVISRTCEMLIKKLDTPSLLAKLLELPSDYEYFSKLLETGIPDPQAIQINLRKYETLYKMCFEEFSLSYFKNFIHRKLYVRKNSDYQKRILANALIFLNKDTNFLNDFIDIIFNDSNNMTLKVSCLITYIVKKDEEENVNKFYLKYGKDKSLLNKWFAMQMEYSTPELALDRLRELTKHKDFNMFNPNNFNSLIGTFAKRNFHAFHQRNGAGYKVIAEWIKKIDAENPQIAASTIKAFDQIRHLPQIYREKAKAAFNVLPDRDNLSRDTSEILYKIKAFL